MITSESFLRQKRDLGEILSATFSFIRLHFKYLFKNILIIAVPIMLLSSYSIYLFYDNMFKNINQNYKPNPLGMMENMLFMMLAVGFAVLILNAVVVEYFRLSLEYDRKEIVPRLIIDGLKKRILRYLGMSILMLLMILIGSLFFIIPGIYLGVALSLVFFIIGIENTDIGDAISRTFTLIKGYWWRSFGLYILAGIIQTVLSYAIILPISIGTSIISAQSVLTNSGSPQQFGVIMAITTAISFFIMILTRVFTLLVIGINYFSIVEAKEEVYLSKQIEQINNKENTNSTIDE